MVRNRMQTMVNPAATTPDMCTLPTDFIDTVAMGYSIMDLGKAWYRHANNGEILSSQKASQEGGYAQGQARLRRPQLRVRYREVRAPRHSKLTKCSLTSLRRSCRGWGREASPRRSPLVVARNHLCLVTLNGSQHGCDVVPKQMVVDTQVKITSMMFLALRGLNLRGTA